MSKSIQICGTGSGVGKSVIVAGLCRIFQQDGFKVAPFKAQNMALNSFVTSEGGEIGRAQAVQAMACGLEPVTDMNPVLIKPTADTLSQVIVHGKPVGNMSALRYTDYKKKLKKEVMAAFNRLKKDFEIVVIEGAGSPAEVNLKKHDIVNMKMAAAAKAPVILVGDIDKGGVFAWLIGTLALLDKNERKRVKGFIINKFRGDKRLLQPGIDFLEKKTKIKVLGVVPYFKEIRIAEEDSVNLDNRLSTIDHRLKDKKLINIAVIRLPYLSNFTDFDPLKNEPDVRLEYVRENTDLKDFDAIIIPGTKNTIQDLLWLKKSGLADMILSAIDHQPSTNLIGICGGYQILGKKIFDHNNTESKQKEIRGLGILPVNTYFEKEKTLARITGRETRSGLSVQGYEIHHGRSQRLKCWPPLLEHIARRKGKTDDTDGMVSPDGRVWGTYVHGIFDADGFRRNFINNLRIKKGWAPLSNGETYNPDREFDKLADLLRKNVDLKLLYQILNG